jgi:acyl carrier protein
MNVRKEVVDIIQDRLCLEDSEVKQINDKTEMKDVISDSLDLIDIIQQIEIKFGIKVPDSKSLPMDKQDISERLSTFGSMTNLVEELIEAKC